MRRLFIAGNTSYPASAATVNAVAAGAMAVFKNTGALVSKTDTALTDYISIVLGRAVSDGGAKIEDIMSVKNAVVTKQSYVAPTKFSATVTIPTVAVNKEYTIIIAKRGTVLNESWRYSLSTRAKDTDTAKTIAAELVKQANAKSIDITASNADGVITIVSNDYVDYKLIPADDISNVVPVVTSTSFVGFGTTDSVLDLWRQCIGSEGKDLNYIGSPLKATPPAISGTFIVYTIRYSNPRISGTSANAENNMLYLHIAVPVGAAQITDLDAIFALIK